MTSVLFISLVYIGLWVALWIADEIDYRKGRKK